MWTDRSSVSIKGTTGYFTADCDFNNRYKCICYIILFHYNNLHRPAATTVCFSDSHAEDLPPVHPDIHSYLDILPWQIQYVQPFPTIFRSSISSDWHDLKEGPAAAALRLLLYQRSHEGCGESKATKWSVYVEGSLIHMHFWGNITLAACVCVCVCVRLFWLHLCWDFFVPQSWLRFRLGCKINKSTNKEMKGRVGIKARMAEGVCVFYTFLTVCHHVQSNDRNVIT